jgi:hypothetical protein
MANISNEVFEEEAKRQESIIKKVEVIQQQEEDGYDGFTDSKVKLIPTPNFTDAKSVGTLLPINMANETVTNVSKLAQEVDLVEFVRQKLNYATRIKVIQCFSSEQIDALCLAIKSFEKGDGFILGDMAGIGKGRICAGVMRYAIQQGFTPMFVTHKPYLFTDIYRDLKSIGFYGTKSNKELKFAPFIMNANDPRESSIKERTESGSRVVFEPLKPNQVRNICLTRKLPKEYNTILLTYSQMSHTRGETKQGFLEEMSKNAIIVFDESHNAASANENSRIIKKSLPLVENCKAILFSSATYAKNPEVFGLYVVRTALRSAVPSLSAITNALKVGGENVAEFIASGLVYEGQMIRRERSYGDCKKVTDYVGTTKNPLTNEVLTNDSTIQKRFYNEAIGYFKELRDFSSSTIAESAILNAILRRCSELGYNNIILAKDFNQASNGTNESKNFWIRENRGKWILSFKADKITRYKATFRENLFLAIKSKFTADKVLECLNTPIEYKNEDGTKHIAPFKPLIAIRNTGESIFNELQLEEGDEINNDFSEYLRSIYLRLFYGDFTLRKVDSNVFESESELVDRGIITEENRSEFFWDDTYNVMLSDFSDGGQRITEIQSRLDAYNSNLPLSAIDYLRDRIESSERPSFYYKDSSKLDALYGEASSTNYKFTEATGRKSRLVYNPETQKWVYSRIEKTSTTDKFLMFNTGMTDVLLINVTASTGGSAQSSPEEGKDTRPRNMFIIQFELDINIEVQKRGRVNRTGQLNTPTYTYIISQIPVELRTYLMFRKKLRKLDANTSANQTASSETSEIYDVNGNPIEDIFNQYGFDVFVKDFIEEPKFIAFKEVFDGMSSRRSSTTNDAEQTEINLEQFNAFVRELELYPTDKTEQEKRDNALVVNQEEFFDEMNQKYIEQVNKLKALGEYQLELEAKNYKASLKQRVVVSLFSGSTIFSLPLFLTDYYTLEDNKALSKEKMMEKAEELATKENKSLTPREFYLNLIEDYNKEYQKFNESLINEFTQKYIPERKDYNNDEDYNDAVTRFEAKLYSLKKTESDKKARMLDFLRFYKPMTEVSFDGHAGYFIGYRIKDKKTRFKYSDGSIEFVFCFLSRYPVLNLKVSSDALTLEDIKNQSILILGSSLGDNIRKQIQDWKPDYNKRIIRRFLAGNILNGIVVANQKKWNDEIKNWSLVRFTNYDGSMNTAIELKYDRPLSEKTLIVPNRTELSVSVGNSEFLTFFNKIALTGFNYIYALWNIETDKLIDRAVSLFRYNDGRMEVQIIQPYKEKTETGQISDYDEKSEKYNKLYYDTQLLDTFRQNQVKRGERQKITYAKKVWKEINKYGQEIEKSKYNEYRVCIKSYEFNLNNDNQRELALQLLNAINNKYDLSFIFRASFEEYYNEDSRTDVFEPDTKVKKEKLYAVGNYEYVFTESVKEDFINQIPDLLDRTPQGTFGGVILSQPLVPSMVASYKLKPIKIPADVLVKLTINQFSDSDKIEFAKLLEEKAQRSPLDVGLFVKSFISKVAVDPRFFFGDMRIPDYGLIFKEYALKNDVTKLVFEEEEEEQVIPMGEAKSKVDFDGAENFLITLITK